MRHNEERDVCALRGKNWRPRHDGITAYRPVRYIKHGRYRRYRKTGIVLGDGRREEARGGEGCREIILSYSIFLWNVRDDKSSSPIEKMRRSHTFRNLHPLCHGSPRGCTQDVRRSVCACVCGNNNTTGYIPEKIYSCFFNKKNIREIDILEDIS